MKYGGMDPGKQQAPKFRDDKLDNMTPAELEAFIKSQSGGLKAVNSGKKSS
jgi:hypothetical protein